MGREIGLETWRVQLVGSINCYTILVYTRSRLRVNHKKDGLWKTQCIIIYAYLMEDLRRYLDKAEHR